jgi:glucose-6-phosphate 1-dehydrogenase
LSTFFLLLRSVIKNPSTVLVILGATGDLVRRKVAPALYDLFSDNLLPQNFQVVAFARREFSNESYREYLEGVLTEHRQIDPKTLNSFLNIFVYRQGNFDNESDYQILAERLGYNGERWQACANKIFYLAVPPEFYDSIFRNIAKFGLTSRCEGAWSRVLVEKPFGRDLKTAESLDALLGELFDEDQIYRIDHYLAKEMMQNILTFRFMNDIFEDSWNARSIEKIELRLWEKVGVERRGQFYDGVGALRDMGQNHLMLMLALVAMDRPASLSPESIRKNRADLLDKLIVPTEEEIVSSTFRAQYAGYKSIENVLPDSDTETYFKLRAYLSSSRWNEVPIFIESGKRMGKSVKDITVTFYHPGDCLCGFGEHHRNKVVFTIEPDEGIKIYFWAKKPGHNFDTEERSFEFMLRDKFMNRQYVEEYQKLLLDAFTGDQTLFTSTEEVQAMWRFIDPIIRTWQENKVKLNHYSPDNEEITIAADKHVTKGAPS